MARTSDTHYVPRDSRAPKKWSEGGPSIYHDVLSATIKGGVFAVERLEKG